MDKRKSLLTQSLKTATGLADLYNSDLFQQNLLPYLKQMAYVPYVAPKEGQSDTEYMFELRVSNLKAGAYHDLLTYMEGMNARVGQMTKELEEIARKEKEIDGK